MEKFCIAISAILGNFQKIQLNPSKHSEILHLNPLEQRDAEFLHRHFCNVRKFSHKIQLNPTHSEILHLNPFEQRGAEFLHPHLCNIS